MDNRTKLIDALIVLLLIMLCYFYSHRQQTNFINLQPVGKVDVAPMQWEQK
jgi:hypothetical protein